MWFLIFIFLKKIHINLSFLGIAIDKLKFISSITYNAVIQKHTAEIAERGVITYFSFLLLEIKFIIVLNERYTAIAIQIIFVILSENHNGINPPICKIIITKNICRITCPTKTILNFFEKTLYYPPIVNSPKGTPQIKRTDIIITIKKVLAPIIAITF